MVESTPPLVLPEDEDNQTIFKPQVKYSQNVLREVAANMNVDAKGKIKHINGTLESIGKSKSRMAIEPLSK
jgi:hypothetical protein